MSDTVDTDNQDAGGLKGSFGDRGLNMNAMGYGHPHADKIIQQAKEVLTECESGQLLFKVIQKTNVPIQILKGSGPSGFSPDMKSITIQTSGKTTELNGDILINIIRGLREAGQEFGGYKTPDPAKDIVKYAEFIHGRNLDSLTFVCKTVKELTNSSYFSVLLDSLTKLGFNKMYKAYIDGASQEELYMEYAEAYNTSNRGSI